MTSSAIRQQARQTLKELDGRYKLFLLPVLLSFFSTGLALYHNYHFLQLNMIMSYQYPPSFNFPNSSAFPQLISILLALFTLATAYTMLEVIRGQRQSVGYDDLGRIFTGRYLLHLFLLFVVHTLLLLPWSLLLTAGGVLMSLPLIFSGNSGAFALILLGGVLFLIGLVMLINRSYSYSQANFVLFDCLEAGQSPDPFTVIKQSKSLMAGRKFQLFLLQLSFLGWHLLDLLTLGLLGIYLIPYTLTAETIFYAQLTEKKTESYDKP